MIEKLISFKDIPLGARFKYPATEGEDNTKVYVVLEKYREHSADEPMSGKIADYWPITEEGTFHRWRQSLYSHFGGSEDCPDMVIWVG